MAQALGGITSTTVVALGTDVGTEDVSAADVTISNSAAETSVYSFSLGAGRLGTTNALYVRVFGIVSTDGVTPGDVTIRFKYGATTLASAAISLGAGLASKPVIIEAWLLGDGATNDQILMMRVTGDIGTAGASVVAHVQADAAEDSTGALTVDVTWDFSVADVDNTYTKKHAYADLKL